ncbi:MAG TPA: TonB-dependent receptor, partial [Vicinamibacteria bacterium]|nr:TonB-dependent receptor [Vicinamibacteria bacterium]
MKARVPALMVPVLLAASVAFPAEEAGGLLGWVEDTRGVPVAGAVISLFGRGVGAAGLVTLSDSTGRFFLPSLPAGSYTVRALRKGHVAPARQITVVPNRELQFTMSLTPEAEAAAAAVGGAAEKAAQGASARPAGESQRELAWLLRHKRRSVLESRREAPSAEDGMNAPRSASLASWLPDLGATLELVTHPDLVGLGDEVLSGESPAASLSALRLQGRLSDTGTWSLGGLVSESGSTSWRMAAEFVLEAGEHEIRAGSGYGTRLLRPETDGPQARDERVGAIFVQDRWSPSDDLSATVAARFTHVGFLERANSLDPSVTVEVRPSDTSSIHAMVATRTLAPGGDLLTLSTLATAPSIALAALHDALRAQRSLRVELGVDENLGASSVRAHAFYESARDHLANAFGANSEAASLRIFNAGRLGARGMGLTVTRRFGHVVSGSMTYSYGRGWRSAQGRALPDDLLVERVLTFEEAGFHDVVARLETV